MSDLRPVSFNHPNLWGAMALYGFAVIATVFTFNTLLGLFVHYQDVQQSIFWHQYSPYCVGMLLSLMCSAVAYECYTFRAGGHTLAQLMRARRLNYVDSTPEEMQALALTEQLARHFAIEVPTVYVLANELGVNALTAGFQPKNSVIILTWGALQTLDEQELYGLLSHQFYQILSGETALNTRLKILYSSLIAFSQWGSQIVQLGFQRHGQRRYRKSATFFVVLGGIIWLFGSLGVLNSRLIKFLSLGRNVFRHDRRTSQMLQSDANVQTLLRIYVHHAGAQIHSEYAEAISHMCFASALSPQSWLNIHPDIEQRIYALNPHLVQNVQLEHLKRLRRQPLFLLFHSLERRMTEDVHLGWQSPQPLPLLRLSPISFAVKDAIKPLNPLIREKMQRPELIERALQTATGSREVMVAILMIRQYREFIPTDAQVSRAIVDALLNLDGRVHVSIFHQACRHIRGMPRSVGRQFLTKLAQIIQEDGEIGLLDVLLLEKVKFELNLMPLRRPSALHDVKPQIVRLVDALLHVQQINTENQLEVREQILQLILTEEELQYYDEISDEPIDLAEIINDVAGLLLRERLGILGIAEACLWNDRIITQDELDVLELLYWRLGFETQEMVEQMQKKNSVMIV